MIDKSVTISPPWTDEKVIALERLLQKLSREAFNSNSSIEELSFTDVTTGDVSTTLHGFCPKAPNNTTQFLRGDGTWAAPATPVVGTKIYDNTLGSAATSIDTDGAIILDAVSHGGYRFIFEGFNASVGAAIFRLFVNGDTTASHYNLRGPYGGTSTGGMNVAECYLDNGGLNAGDIIRVDGSINIVQGASSNKYIVANFLTYRTTINGAGISLAGGINYLTAAANLTRMAITSSVSSAIGVGSRLRIWRVD